ncbi:MAG TPA: AAA family ATPase [Legionella sp.]|nr:AAA family ATPase [Legionella sp.]
MSGFYIWRKISPVLLEEYLPALTKFAENPYTNGQDWEDLGKGLFRIKANDKARLLFIKIRHENKTVLVLVDIMENHKYENNPLLKSDHLKRLRKLITESLVNQTKEEEEEEEEEEEVTSPSNTTSFNFLDFYANQWVSLNHNQEKALPAPLPLILTGIPGSGKSLVAKSLLHQLQNNLAPDADEPIAYIGTKELVSKMQEQWIEPEESVLFLTFEQFAQYQGDILPEKNAVSYDFFKVWFNVYLKNENKRLETLKVSDVQCVTDPILLYQELRLLSGFDTSTEYLNAGDRQTLIHNQAEKLWVLSTAEHYQKYLNQYKKNDYNLFAINTQLHRQFSAIIVDEVQSYTPIKLKQIVQQTKNNNLVFCGDSNQSYEGLSSLVWLKTKKFPHATVHQLTDSFRCPPKVIHLANQILALKNYLLGGVLYKGQETEIHATSNFDEQKGMVKWINPDDKEELDRLKKNVNSSNVAVIVTSEMRDLARTTFSNHPLIMTIDEIRGLEYPTIVLFELFNEPQISKLAPLINSDHKKINSNRTNKDINALIDFVFSGLFTAVTRSSENLLIIHTENYTTQCLINSLKPSNNTNQIDQELPASKNEINSTRTDWEHEFFRQWKIPNTSIAWDIYTRYLQKEGVPFLQFLQKKYTQFLQVNELPFIEYIQNIFRSHLQKNNQSFNEYLQQQGFNSERKSDTTIHMSQNNVIQKNNSAKKIRIRKGKNRKHLTNLDNNEKNKVTISSWSTLYFNYDAKKNKISYLKEWTEDDKRKFITATLKNPEPFLNDLKGPNLMGFSHIAVPLLAELCQNKSFKERLALACCDNRLTQLLPEKNPSSALFYLSLTEEGINILLNLWAIKPILLNSMDIFHLIKTLGTGNSVFSQLCRNIFHTYNNKGLEKKPNYIGLFRYIIYNTWIFTDKHLGLALTTPSKEYLTTPFFDLVRTTEGLSLIKDLLDNRIEILTHFFHTTLLLPVKNVSCISILLDYGNEISSYVLSGLLANHDVLNEFIEQLEVQEDTQEHSNSMVKNLYSKAYNHSILHLVILYSPIYAKLISSDMMFGDQPSEQFNFNNLLKTGLGRKYIETYFSANPVLMTQVSMEKLFSRFNDKDTLFTYLTQSNIGLSILTLLGKNNTEINKLQPNRNWSKEYLTTRYGDLNLLNQMCFPSMFPKLIKILEQHNESSKELKTESNHSLNPRIIVSEAQKNANLCTQFSIEELTIEDFFFETYSTDKGDYERFKSQQLMTLVEEIHKSKDYLTFKFIEIIRKRNNSLYLEIKIPFEQFRNSIGSVGPRFFSSTNDNPNYLSDSEEISEVNTSHCANTVSYESGSDSESSLEGLLDDSTIPKASF